ncbi:MAG: metallophosphoesterase [Chloroflexi bacterium]|nr:metallophosphoesterase [Chloroflexota bacterium]
MRYAVLGLLALAAAVLGYAARIEPRRLVFRRRVFEFDDSQFPLERLTILHLSDLHIRKPDPSMTRWLEPIFALKPDLTIMTGDFIEFDSGTDFCAELVSRLSSRLGIYGVLGNHDHFYRRSSLVSQIVNAVRNVINFTDHSPNDVPALVRKLGEAGARMLINENVRLQIEGKTVWLAGVDDPISERDNLPKALEGIQREDFTILLSHSPESIFAAEERGVDLVLAGHTHGGQVRLPFVGAVTSRTRHRVPIVGGAKRVGRAWLHVSPGLGASVPLRFLCPPEVTLIELRSRSG